MFRSINKFIIFLTSSNLFMQASHGFVMPVLAVFAKENLADGTLATAGVAVGVFWIVKSILQIFVGRYLDAVGDEKSQFQSLIIGHIIMAAVPFLYLGVSTAIDLYLTAGLLGVGAALSVPPIFVLFSRHADKNKESFEWSLNSSVSLGIGTGVSGIVGGYIVEGLGFQWLFIIAGLVGVVSIFVMMPLYKYLMVTAPAKSSPSGEAEKPDTTSGV